MISIHVFQYTISIEPEDFCIKLDGKMTYCGRPQPCFLEECLPPPDTYYASYHPIVSFRVRPFSIESVRDEELTVDVLEDRASYRTE
jgi:hypothetical protein